MARQSAIVLCLAAAVVLQLLLPAQAHMVMIEPKSRQWLDYTLRYNYNPHAVNGGGVDVVSNKGKLNWPARNLGSICGDEPGQKKWDTPGTITGTYKSGGEITTDIVFAQNHLGRVFMSVCPLNAKSESECTPLQRADGAGTSYDLPWTRGWAGVSDGFTPTVEPIKEFGVYKMKPYGKAEGCAAWACDQFKGMFVYSFKWKLPAGFKCDQCKLLHYYLTASRCWPACISSSGNCKKPVIYANCGAPGATYPEEFWNCADIKIN